MRIKEQLLNLCTLDQNSCNLCTKIEEIFRENTSGKKDKNFPSTRLKVTQRPPVDCFKKKLRPSQNHVKTMDVDTHVFQDHFCQV